MRRAAAVAILLFAAPAFASAAESPIDQAVFARLKSAGIAPADVCDDATFVRRAFLDVIGTLPTADDARAFIQDKDPAKRAKLIDRLLDRPEYADFWAMRWGDVLRMKSEFPVNLWPNAVQAYHRWVREALAQNMPYDRFVREMLTSSGSNFRVGQVNFWRAVQGKDPPALAKAVALTFLCDRMDSWPQDRKDGLASFFKRVGYKSTGEWKEEIVFFDIASKPVASAVLPDGSVAAIAPDRDPREIFADWLVSAKNPWFARAEVNRLWYWLLGRGLIHEPDDVRPDNPPSEPEVLAYLEKEFVASKYDVKRVLRLILNSKTYQLSSKPASKDPKAASLFAAYPMRRMDAEVLIDALCRVTGSTEEYSSRIPEPFTYVPPDVRAIALPDGSITSPFLDLFGRPARDTGMASERNNTLSPAQELHLLNSSHIRKKIEQSSVLRSMRRESSKDPDKAASDIYLLVLSRFPTKDELGVLKGFSDPGRGKSGDAMSDLMWALINSPEFIYLH